MQSNKYSQIQINAGIPALGYSADTDTQICLALTFTRLKSIIMGEFPKEKEFPSKLVDFSRFTSPKMADFERQLSAEQNWLKVELHFSETIQFNLQN